MCRRPVPDSFHCPAPHVELLAPAGRRNMIERGWHCRETDQFFALLRDVDECRGGFKPTMFPGWIVPAGAYPDDVSALLLEVEEKVITPCLRHLVRVEGIPEGLDEDGAIKLARIIHSNKFDTLVLQFAKTSADLDPEIRGMLYELARRQCAHIAKAKPETPGRKKSRKYKFDADRITALIDKMSRERSALETPGTPLTLSEIDALRTQVERCWIVQAGTRYGEELVVTLRVFLNPDGSLRSEPKIVDEARFAADPDFPAAAESAIRAVLKCEPFKMPVAKYHRWREIELTFDPRGMLR